jgi:hypothetical protein
VAKPRLHLDADASIKAVYNALRERGHNVTRTPNEWIAFEAGDREQLLGATAQGRVLFTFNVRDFQILAKQYSEHHGIILAVQSRWTIATLIESLDRALTRTEEADWLGVVRWLNDFKE